jgi:hypothetical protein
MRRPTVSPTARPPSEPAISDLAAARPLAKKAGMNKHEFSGRNGEARLRYLDSDFQVVVPGAYVTCAVTGQRIPLSDLRYWSVDRQEAYADAAASLKRELALRRGK